MAQVTGGTTFAVSGPVGATPATSQAPTTVSGSGPGSGGHAGQTPDGTKPAVDTPLAPAAPTEKQKEWLKAGREAVGRQFVASLNAIQKLKAQRIVTWGKNASVKDSKPVRDALDVAVSIAAEGIGGVVGGFLTGPMAHTLMKEFVYLAGLEATDLATEKIFHVAMERNEATMTKGTAAALASSKAGSLDTALATKSSLLDGYTEALTLQTVAEELAQVTEFNKMAAGLSDLELIDQALGLQALYDALNAAPQAFMRELSAGMIRLLDEIYELDKTGKYGGDRAKMLREDPDVHETGDRKGNLLLIPDGLAPLGTWGNPGYSALTGFHGLGTGVNSITFNELSGVPVGQLPISLGFRFWAANPYSGLLSDPLVKVWFSRRPDGGVWVDFDDADDADGLEWLASYGSGISRELTEQERVKHAPNGAQKVYDHIKDLPLSHAENFDIL